MRPHNAVVEGVVDHPASLLVAWRARAAYLEQFGDPTSAKLWLLAAVELEQALKAHGEETLTLVEAAALSGYSADHLGWLTSGAAASHAKRRWDLPVS